MQRAYLPLITGICRLTLVAAILLGLSSAAEVRNDGAVHPLWELARRERATHEFNTLFTAQDVRRHLGDEEGIATAIEWCRRNAVTKVFLETFRSHFQVDEAVIARARDRFRDAGFDASGCITTTNLGRPSTGWKELITCYTDPAAQKKLKAVFEFCARFFDEIMIDDFWFTDCACRDCDAARKARTVTIGDRTFSTPGDTWEDYRGELMVQLSRLHVLAAAQAVNPRVRVIIKYPQWYDRFHERGYDVRRQSDDFDLIWVGTETRDYTNPRWGGKTATSAHFLMRWLGGIGGAKCGGGWFDPLGTTEQTYLEQARMTILGGARTSTLFAYGNLQRDTGPRNLEVFRSHVPELLQVAAEVKRRTPSGIAVYKPIASPGDKEAWVFNFIGNLGFPTAPCHEFPADAPAAFFSVHALKDPNFVPRLAAFLATGRPVLLTDGLRERLAGKLPLDGANVFTLPVRGAPKELLSLDQAALDALREPLLRPLKIALRAPAQVGLFLFTDGSWVLENFADTPAVAELNGERLTLTPRGWLHRWK